MYNRYIMAQGTVWISDKVMISINYKTVDKANYIQYNLKNYSCHHFLLIYGILPKR